MVDGHLISYHIVVRGLGVEWTEAMAFVRKDSDVFSIAKAYTAYTL